MRPLTTISRFEDSTEVEERAPDRSRVERQNQPVRMFASDVYRQPAVAVVRAVESSTIQSPQSGSSLKEETSCAARSSEKPSSEETASLSISRIATWICLSSRLFWNAFLKEESRDSIQMYNSSERKSKKDMCATKCEKKNLDQIRRCSQVLDLPQKGSAAPLKLIIESPLVCLFFELRWDSTRGDS